MLNKVGYRDYDKVGGIDDIGISNLSKVYSNVVSNKKRMEAEREQEFNLSMPHLEALRNKLAEKISEEVDKVSGHLPVISVFDALQVVKARKDANKNVGVRALGGHLQSMWKNNRTANITANSFLNLRDHYVRNYPKSGMDEIFDVMSKKGYFTLPISDLTHIASQIESQEDFDYLVMKHGLNGNQPHQVKARKFVLAILNNTEDQENHPFERRGQGESLSSPEDYAEMESGYSAIDNEGYDAYEEAIVQNLRDQGYYQPEMILDLYMKGQAGIDQLTEEQFQAVETAKAYAAQNWQGTIACRVFNKNKKGQTSKMEKGFRLPDDFIDFSVSHATMIDTDIVEAIERDMQGVVPNDNTLWGAIEEFWAAEEDSEDRAFLLNETIWDEMNDIAPEGTYFGAHPGDGSDYGFWSAEDEDLNDEEDEEDEEDQ